MSRAVLKSLVVKRSVIIDGHKTSMSLEDDFWQGVKKIAAGRRVTIAGLVHEIDSSASKEIYRQPSGCSCWSITAAEFMHSGRRPSRALVRDATPRRLRLATADPHPFRCALISLNLDCARSNLSLNSHIASRISRKVAEVFALSACPKVKTLLLRR